MFSGQLYPYQNKSLYLIYKKSSSGCQLKYVFAVIECVPREVPGLGSHLRRRIGYQINCLTFLLVWSKLSLTGPRKGQAEITRKETASFNMADSE